MCILKYSGPKMHLNTYVTVKNVIVVDNIIIFLKIVLFA